MYSKTSTKLQCIVFIIVLCAGLINSESVTMNTLLRGCSYSLVTMLHQICSGEVTVSDLPESSLPKMRGVQWGSSLRRGKRSIVEECCIHSCTVSQIIEYC
ncbi:hypothetical protein NE865_02572 [Phthorimaea operculella]|nr:hypothetical protein NE865_02572 [Phthorimaea operculella]